MSRSRIELKETNLDDKDAVRDALVDLENDAQDIKINKDLAALVEASESEDAVIAIAALKKLAKHHLGKNDLEGVLQCYAEARQRNDAATIAFMALTDKAQEAYKSGNYEQAIVLNTEAGALPVADEDMKRLATLLIEKIKTTIQDLKQSAQKDIEDKDYSTAIESYIGVIKGKGDVATEFMAKIEAAQQALLSGDYEAAGRIYEEARTLPLADSDMKTLATLLNDQLDDLVKSAKQRILELKFKDENFNKLITNLAALHDASETFLDGLDEKTKEDKGNLNVKKSEVLKVLADQIEQKITGFIVKLLNPAIPADKKDENAFESLKKEIAAEVNGADVVLQQHRQKNAQFRIIVENILIALTGVGLLALIGKAIYVNVKQNKGDNTPLLNKYAFFGETASAQKAEDVNNLVASTNLSALTQGA